MIQYKHMDNNVPIFSQPENGMNSVPQQPLPQQPLPQQSLPQQPAVQGDTPSSSEPMTKKRKILIVLGGIGCLVVICLIIFAIINIIKSAQASSPQEFFSYLIYGPKENSDSLEEADTHSMSEIKAYLADYGAEENKIYPMTLLDKSDTSFISKYYEKLNEKLTGLEEKYQNNSNAAGLLAELDKTLFLFENLNNAKFQLILIDKIKHNDTSLAKEYVESAYESEKPEDEGLLEIYDLEKNMYNSYVDYFEILSNAGCFLENSVDTLCIERQDLLVSDEINKNLYYEDSKINDVFSTLESKIVSYSQEIIAEIEK